jgi:hypothetical protein
MGLWQEDREEEQRLMSVTVTNKGKSELGNVTWRLEVKTANEITCDYVWDKLLP